MKNNRWIFVIFLLVLGLFLALNLKNKPKNSEQSLLVNNKDEPTFLIEGFPIDKVPLYKLTKVSSNKIFVNTDPINLSNFGEENFAYYNVVFYSDASQEEFLNYYKSLFESQIVEEYDSPDMVKGVIGQYKVSAAHYGSGDTGYVQVHLKDYNDDSLNKYFLDFPDVLEVNSSLVEHEKSYGLLNQKGGEIEYTKYFTVIDSGDQNDDGADDVDEFSLLEQDFKKENQDKAEYSYDEESGTMKWNDKDFEVTLVISRDHGRIYLMLRKGMDK